MERLEKRDIATALLCSRASLRYFTNYSPPLASAFSALNPLLGSLLLCRGKAPHLFLASEESEIPLAEIEHECVVEYSLVTEASWIEKLLERIIPELRRLPPGKLAYEGQTIPASLALRLQASSPHLEWMPVEAELLRLHAVKDEDEIEAIRAAVALADLGHEAVCRMARPGTTELELFAAARQAMELQAGARVQILANFMSGPRTAACSGPPTSRKLQPGDLVISDLTPHLAGYWGDTCTTCAVDEPSANQRRAYSVLTDALDEALAALRPGLQAGEFDRRMRAAMAMRGVSYSHHSGHGIGLHCHEPPALAPGCEMTLEPGMVVALEPGMYFPGHWGMRIEHVALVTEHGAELLSRFQHRLA